MNRNAPDWYRDPSVSDSLRETRELIHHVQKLGSRAMAPSPSSNSGSQHIAKRGVSIGFTRRDSGSWLMSALKKDSALWWASVT
jgi:hypothetical protein